MTGESGRDASNGLASRPRQTKRCVRLLLHSLFICEPALWEYICKQQYSSILDPDKVVAGDVRATVHYRVAGSDGSFVPGSNPGRVGYCHHGCAYTVLQTIQRPGVHSAAYGTVHYKEPLKLFGLPSVAISPWLCRKRGKAILTHFSVGWIL